MNEDLDKLLLTLDKEIDKKCFEIKEKKAIQMYRRIFIIFCGIFLITPSLFILVGVNIVTLGAPIICFLGIALFILSPIILSSKQGGGLNEF